MSASAAAQTSALFRTVLNGLPYYNERAKQAETLKYSTEELQRMVEAWPASVLLANINNEPVGFCFCGRMMQRFGYLGSEYTRLKEKKA
jgi:hypothetical protein